MRTLRTCLLAAFVLFSGLLGPAYAREGISLVTPYEKALTRSAGAPNTAADTFAVPTTQGQFWLTVVSSGVTAGSVTLNGVEVFGPSSFKKSVTLLRAPVTVTSPSTIELQLAGQPGESFRVRLDGVVPDSSIPSNLVQHVFQRASFFTETFSGSGSAKFSLPTAAGLFWLDVVNGTAQGTNRASSASVVLDGTTVFSQSSFSQQTASLEAPVLVAATNHLAVTITGPKGASVTVTLRGYGVDTTPPSLSIDEPTPGVWHRLAGSVRISYSDSISGIDPSSFAAAINATDVTSRFSATAANASASFAALYPPFHEGANQLSASIADNAVNVTTKEITALVDSKPPQISVSPGDGSVTNNHPTFTVSVVDPSPGSGPDMTTFRASLDGQPTSAFAITGTMATLSFTNLASGDHSLAFSVADVAGNPAQLTIRFHVERPPVVSVTPADGSATNDTSPAIVVTHIADAGATITLPTVATSLDGTSLTAVAQTASASVFLPNAPLAEGAHSLAISVSDNFGNTTTFNTTFRVELTATHLGLSIAPSDSQSVLVFSLNSLTISALTPSNLVAKGFTGTIQVTTTNGLATLDQLFATIDRADEGVVTIPNLAIVRETGPITVSAVALASPSVTGTLALVGVNTVPSFSAAPVTPDGATILTVQTVPNASVTVLVDGMPMFVADANAQGVATIPLSLSPGAHTIEVIATAPNGTSAGRSIIQSIGPPTTVSGLVFDGTIAPPAPLANVVMTVEGTGVSGLTDNQGRFTLANVPLGSRVLSYNGSRIPNRSLGVTRIGITANTPVTLPALVMRPINYSSGTLVVDPIQGATIRNPSLPGMTVSILAGPILLPPAAPPILTVTQVSLLDLPITLPDGLASSLFVSLGPEGTRAPAGIKLTLPNVDRVQPGATTPVWHYRAETGKWEIAGNALASADGATLSLDPDDFGIYSAAAPTVFEALFLADIRDEFGTQLTPPTDVMLFSGPNLGGVLFISAGPNAGFYLLVYHLPIAPTATSPFDAALRVTRYFWLS